MKLNIGTSIQLNMRPGSRVCSALATVHTEAAVCGPAADLGGLDSIAADSLLTHTLVRLALEAGGPEGQP